jgi:hypothetical protein
MPRIWVRPGAGGRLAEDFVDGPPGGAAPVRARRFSARLPGGDQAGRRRRHASGHGRGLEGGRSGIRAPPAASGRSRTGGFKGAGELTSAAREDRRGAHRMTVSFLQPSETIEVFGSPTRRLARVLDFLAERLHPTIETLTGCAGYSRTACILSSLVARDVMCELGFAARVAPVITRVRKHKRGRPIRELIIGEPGRADEPGMWNAHMIVLVEGLLVDFTLDQARRPAWPELPGMLAAAVSPDGTLLEGRFPRLVALSCPAREIEASWFDNPEKDDWREAPDARPKIRKAIVRKLSAKARKRGLLA